MNINKSNIQNIVQANTTDIRLVIATITSLVFSFNVNAEQRQDVKCYVELFGGSETVVFVETYGEQAKHLNKIAKQWLNQKVVMPGSKEKKAIYKVNECALLNIPFSTSKARAVDDKTAR